MSNFGTLSAMVMTSILIIGLHDDTQIVTSRHFQKKMKRALQTVDARPKEGYP